MKVFITRQIPEVGIKKLKDAETIFTDAKNWEVSIDSIFKSAQLDNYVERKNKFLDHLLARFSEKNIRESASFGRGGCRGVLESIRIEEERDSVVRKI